MLPEKKKKLIIGIFAIIALVILIILLASLSNYIKSKHVDETRKNDDYASNYLYYGITKDTDGIYKLYGISDASEDYLALRSFYEITDLKIINDKIVLYSDAVNEIRYEKDKNEYYFYELDSFYKNSYKGFLCNDYLVLNGNNKILYHKFGEEENKEIADNITNIVTNDNFIYYVKNDKIYKYDLVNELEKVITDNGQDVELLEAQDNYLYYYQYDKLYCFGEKSNEIKDMGNVKFVDSASENLLYVKDNTLYDYSLINGDIKEYKLSNELISGIYLDSENYYLVFQDESGILQMNNDFPRTKLSNEYLFMVKVMDDED